MKTAAAPAEEQIEVSTHSIRDSIRDAIVDRRLAPGTKLSEADVGTLFNVSRTLVRSALQALSYEGLVSVEKNRGAFVAHPSPEEARQIFATRRMIEPGILREAAQHMGPGLSASQAIADGGRPPDERAGPDGTTCRDQGFR
jgi:DNA-binding GntR family transcriptional regulator